MSDNTSINKESGNKPSDYYAGVNQLIFNMVPLDAQRILEVGCANGRLGAAIKSRNFGCHYVGIELFEEAGANARMVLDNVFIADVERFDWTSLSGERFDCIIFADVLEHLVNPAETLRAATAFLSQSGCLLCCLPNISHWSIIKGLLRGEWQYADSGVLDRTHLRFYTLQTFKTLLQECGFQAVRYARYFTDLTVDESVIPLLNSLQVNAEAFMERANTIQFLVKAERIVELNGDVSVAKISEQINEAGPSYSVTVITYVNDGVLLTDKFLDAIYKARTSHCSPNVLVADDASSELTSEGLQAMARSYDWLEIIRFGNPLGISRARNWAAGNSDADFLVFMDGNSIVHADWLSKMLAVIQDKKVGIVGPQLRFPDGSVSQAGIVFTAEARAEYLYRNLNGNDPRVVGPKEVPAVSGSCLLIKRELFQSLQGFSTNFPVFYSEIDLCYRVRRRGLSVVYQPESKIVHPESGNGFFARVGEAQDIAGQRAFLDKWQELLYLEMQADPSFYITGRNYLT